MTPFLRNVTSAGRTSPYSLYKSDLATYGVGDTFDHSAATGFIELWGLPLQVATAVKNAATAKKGKGGKKGK